MITQYQKLFVKRRSLTKQLPLSTRFVMKRKLPAWPLGHGFACLRTSVDLLFSHGWKPMASQSPPDTGEKIVLPLHTEDVSVERRAVERDVRVRVRTTSHEQLVDEALAHENVEIERIVVNRPVDAVPPIREEGDLTVISVVEEVLVVERRLVLKEEIHVRRVRTTTRHRETVTLREEEVVIERAEPSASLSALPSDLAPIPKPQTPRTNQDE
jgi:hypothetical protein